MLAMPSTSPLTGLRRSLTWTFVVCLLATPWLNVAEARTVVHAGHLIDGVADDAVAERTVIVEDGRIVEVLPGYVAAEEGDTLIDLRQHTVLPGLMDMHTHITHESSPTAYSDRIRLEYTDYAIGSVVYAERTLMAGFTTVRDLGDRGNVSIALRNAINRGVVPGPRIFTAAKSLATTGGHADMTNGLRSDLAGDPGPREGVVDNPGAAAEAVRHRYKDGADVIKITATGGVLSLAKNSQNPQFSEDLIRVIVETANDYGMGVAAHAHGAEGMKRAIRAGVRSIEHGTYMDDEVIALMKQHGTYLVPTILAGKFVEEKAAIPGYFPEVVRPKAATVGPLIHDTFRRAYAEGVTIAFGTDSGVSPHGENAREFRFMVEGGMPAMAAIQSATRVSAELLEIDDRLGTLEAGKIADLVAVAGNPLDDITLLENVQFVMKDGTVYKHHGE